MLERYYSHGKLLISGEYFVLQGAKSLAVPTKLGQSLEFESNDSGKLRWQSFDYHGNLWFETELRLPDFEVIHVKNKIHLPFLLTLLKISGQLNSTFVERISGRVQNHVEFHLDWGLGSSSTLIHNIAQWAHIDSFCLGKKSTSGSLYDLAVAQFNSPIIYQIIGHQRISEIIEFNPPFLSFLFLIHLNRKQKTNSEIQKFNQIKVDKKDINKISEITENIKECRDFKIFNELLHQHECLLSKILQTETIQSRLFSDFKGVIKSLGAWNGDFILASGATDTIEYFKRKGYTTILKFSDLIR